MAVKLLHEDLTRRIIGAGMDVYNGVGPGWDEWDYHRAMLKALSDRGLKAESHLRGKLMHREQCVDRFELDIMVEDKVVLELKQVRTGFAPEHHTQLINYLKFWKKDLGLLLNFGADRFLFKRVPYTPMDCSLGQTGPWNELERIGSVRLEKVIEACSNILCVHGLGYSKGTSEILLRCEMEFLGLGVRNPVIDLQFGDLKLGARESDCLVIDSGLAIRTSAMHENTRSTDL